MQTYHLYSDGNSFPRAKKSGFGGYIEGPNGEIVVEYTEQIKQPEYFHSFELLGIIRGLEFAKKYGIDSIVSHCDDKNTAFKLKEIFEENIYNVSPSVKPELFDRIIELSKEFKKIKFEYIPRALNKHADALSRRYASLMEENFIKQYHNELNESDKRLTKGVHITKRIFFSHPSIVRNPFKSNPFLVAPTRNKKVRRLSKDEQVQEYEFVFTEIYKNDSSLHFKTIQFDKNHQEIDRFEKIIDKTENVMVDYIEHITNSLNQLKNKPEKLWIDTNFRSINNFFEQKEKIDNKIWDSFIKMHESLSPFKRVFFHHFPFDLEYSPENKEQEVVKKKIDENIENLEYLMERLEKGVLGKEKNKCFAGIIRHQLKNYQATLEREMDDIEKNQIIQQTVEDLNKKGFKIIKSY